MKRTLLRYQHSKPCTHYRKTWKRFKYFERVLINLLTFVRSNQLCVKSNPCYKLGMWKNHTYRAPPKKSRASSGIICVRFPLSGTSNKSKADRNVCKLNKQTNNHVIIERIIPPRFRTVSRRNLEWNAHFSASLTLNLCTHHRITWKRFK